MGALDGCRHVPGWERSFLTALENGYTERMAMNASGIGMANVKNRCERDAVFKERYEAAKASPRRNPSGLL